MKKSLPCLIVFLITTGCKVGPDYHRPDAPVAERWLDMKETGAARPENGVRWWSSFGDPVLDALVDQALRQNLTLRQAGLRVIQARALRGISTSAWGRGARSSTASWSPSPGACA